MNNTEILQIVNTFGQTALFLLSALIGVLLLTQVLRWIAKTKKGDETDATNVMLAFPFFSVITKGFLLALTLMAALSANTWLPKVNTSSPAVNATIRSQIHADADKPIEVKPVVVKGFEEKDAARASRVEEIRQQFQELPDAE